MESTGTQAGIAVRKRTPNLHAIVPGFLLSRLLGSMARVRVLGALFASGEAMGGREVARRGRMPSSTAAQALGELVDMGLVLRIKADGRTRYTLNRQHVLYGPIRALFQAEAAVPDSLAGFLAGRLETHPQRTARLALSFSERGEVLALVPGSPPGDQEEVGKAIQQRYGLVFRGFVNQPSAGSERYGVWQEFSHAYPPDTNEEGVAPEDRVEDSPRASADVDSGDPSGSPGRS